MSQYHVGVQMQHSNAEMILEGFELGAKGWAMGGWGMCVASARFTGLEKKFAFQLAVSPPQGQHALKKKGRLPMAPNLASRIPFMAHEPTIFNETAC